MAPLTEALIAAGTELARDHGWNFSDAVNEPPKADSEFVVVMRKHIEPLITGEWIKVRREALLRELAMLDELMGEPA